MSSNAVTMQHGQVVAGRYRIEELIGQGGFGVVFKATQLPIDRPVALKMLTLESLAHEEQRARFRREAELAQKLEHPNTVRLYDFGETEDRSPYIAWEYLEGRPLDAVLVAEGRLTPARVARIAAQTLKALKEAHDKGIVHRDIKPSNVFLCEVSGDRDVVKVLDFGIAKDTFIRGTGLTPEGSILGTPAYMAPEQVRGGPIGPPADLYSLGLVMAELCTGLAVYPGLVPLEVVTAQLSELPVPLAPALLDTPLGPVIARATQKRLEARYGSAAEMLADLDVAIASPALATSVVPALGASETLPPTEFPRSSGPRALAATATATRPEPSRAAPTLVGEEPSQALREAPLAVAMGGGGPAGLCPPNPLPPTRVPPAVPPPTRVQVAVDPPPEETPETQADGSQQRSSRALVALGIGAVFLALGGAVALIVYTTTTERPQRPPVAPPRPSTPAPAAPPVPAPVPSPVARHFAHLGNKQLRARIEAAGHKVVEEKPGDPVTVFVLAGSGHYVEMIRMGDAKAAEAMEQAYGKQSGATARDGACVLHVDLSPPAAARALLDHIAR
jgi:serine/threonine-protein kinase